MIRLKFGNHKLGDDTAVFNMSTAKECPSKKLGLCPLYNGTTKIKYKNGNGLMCYAEKAEQLYPTHVPAYRRAQQAYWQDTPAERILQDIAKRVESRWKPTRYFRYNESGDFHDQSDIGKLSYIAEGLGTLNITTYGYSARSDLDFSNAKFLVKGSGNTKGNNGACTVVETNERPPEGYLVCPGDCRKCNLCKIDRGHNIAFKKH